MNAFQRRIKEQGSERFLKVGSRVFTWHAMANGKGRELSEVLDAKEGTVSTFPGYWRGQKHYGFPLLASAALDRKHAMLARDEWARRRLISRAFQEIDSARDFGRPNMPWLCEPVEYRRAA
jgi:hypothetical protein